VPGNDPSAYGEAVGADYDVLYPEGGLDTDDAVTMLERLARRGLRESVLEFGVGTGRLALKLHERGVRVVGIDASQQMVAQLRAKPQGAELEITVGDYVTTRIDGTFSVVALTFNSIFDPPTRETQIDCFLNAAHHLEPGGRFVIEAFVLSDNQRSGDWSILPRFVKHEHVELQLARFHMATSRLERTLVHLRPEGVRFITVSDNYAAPGELDLMAAIGGFRLESRSSKWNGAVFGPQSKKHISVYVLDRDGG
jgi:SAM-dependent methyltransferase